MAPLRMVPVRSAPERSLLASTASVRSLPERSAFWRFAPLRSTPPSGRFERSAAYRSRGARWPRVLLNSSTLPFRRRSMSAMYGRPSFRRWPVLSVGLEAMQGTHTRARTGRWSMLSIVSFRTDTDSLPFAVAGASTRIGKAHRENQDCYQVLDGRTSPQVRDLRRGLLYAVADGVSTLEQGRWAAEITCARLAQFFEEGHAARLDTLVQLVGEIDWELRGQGKGKAACTLGALWLHQGEAHVLHVGDSPVYRLRDGVV